MPKFFVLLTLGKNFNVNYLLRQYGIELCMKTDSSWESIAYTVSNSSIFAVSYRSSDCSGYTYEIQNAQRFFDLKKNSVQNVSRSDLVRFDFLHNNLGYELRFGFTRTIHDFETAKITEKSRKNWIFQCASTCGNYFIVNEEADYFICASETVEVILFLTSSSNFCG